MLLVDEKSAKGSASLSASTHSSEGASFECHFEVSVLMDNSSIVTSELKKNASKSIFDLPPNQSANSAGASEGYQRHSWIFTHLLTDICTSLEDGYNIGVDVIFLENISNNLSSGNGH